MVVVVVSLRVSVTVVVVTVEPGAGESTERVVEERSVETADEVSSSWAVRAEYQGPSEVTESMAAPEQTAQSGAAGGGVDGTGGGVDGVTEKRVRRRRRRGRGGGGGGRCMRAVCSMDTSWGGKWSVRCLASHMTT